MAPPLLLKRRYEEDQQPGADQRSAERQRQRHRDHGHQHGGRGTPHRCRGRIAAERALAQSRRTTAVHRGRSPQPLQPAASPSEHHSAAMACRNGSFHLESPAFRDGGLIPAIHSGEGLNLSPPLRWSGAPAHTASYALLMEDPDAPGGSWVHWLLFNIPPQLRALPAGLERSAELPNGARHGSCWGVGRFERIGYQGPQPPPGRAHRYVFELLALKRPLPLNSGCTVFELRAACDGQVLARTQLTGLYASAAPPPTPSTGVLGHTGRGTANQA